MSPEVQSSGNKKVDHLRKLLYRYSLALTLAVVAIAALILSFADSKVSTGDKLTQIGTGLAASAIFALVYTLLANREYAQLIRTEIAEKLGGHLNDTLVQIGHLNELFLPTHQYPATKEFEERFNIDLSEDLCRSSSYTFRGTSAKYVPARISECNHGLRTVQVIMLDPMDPNTMDARVRDRRMRPKYKNKTTTQIKEEIKDEILFALVALFDCRNVCDIEVGFTTTTSSVRVEIFDRAIYTSLYRTQESQRSTHPSSVRFASDSQTYQIFDEELQRQFQLSSSRKLFRLRDTDEDLCAYVTSLGYPEIGQAELETQRHAYQEFIAPFKKFLNQIGISDGRAER
jgi:hypothetical protein